MRPKSEQPAKHFWKSGSRQCVLYLRNGVFEVRLLDSTGLVTTAVCRDGGHAHKTAQKWLAHPPDTASRTSCPRCTHAETRLSSHTNGFVYLHCAACRAEWRIPERRGSDRVRAETAFLLRRSHRSL